MSETPNSLHLEKNPKSANESTDPHWLGYGLAIILAAGAFAAGVHIGQGGGASYGQQAGLFSWLFDRQSRPQEEVDLGEFWRVWNILEDKYVSASTTKSISNEEKLQGAISGLVDSYDDPYTVYLPPEETKIFEGDISGNFSGVGMEVGLREGVITVIAPLPETPAEKAGLMAGDAIVRINGESTENMRIDEAVRIIRGEAGTEVTFTIYREGDTEFKTITVTRANIDIPTVKTEQIGNTFIISLYSFNAISEEVMDEAMSEYRNSNSENLVLDLRGNPGGFLQSAVSIAGYFLPAGKVVVREQARDESEVVFRSSGEGVQQYSPDNFVVLVNGGSASASEILAGALKDHGVATLIGETTFGKGSVQELIDLPNSASLKVTVARWLTPNGISISKAGLEPDIQIEVTAEDREMGNDPQLEAALQFLRGETIAGESFFDSF